MKATPVLTAVVGNNADLIAQAARLYLKPGAHVLDVTYGKGVFWRSVDLSRFTLVKSDIEPADDATHRADFRKLPWRADRFDVVVLDPPYMHGGATVKASIRSCYRNGGAATKCATHEAIIEIYDAGMAEAHRVLKPGGLLWVKCQDEIESGKQRWSHVEILELAHYRGFDSVDLFVLAQSTVPARRLDYQLHARKNHSYLWILKKRQA